MSWVQLIVPGKPIPKKRPRVVRGHVYTPRESVEYESRVAWEARLSKVAFPPKTKLFVDFRFYLASRSYSLTDLDNLQKSALDGMVGMFNDRDVDEIHAIKLLCEPDQERTEINVAALPTKRTD